MGSDAGLVAAVTRSAFALSYVTDVEGNLAYLQRVLAASPVLQLRSGTLEFIHPNGHFVFGP